MLATFFSKVFFVFSSASVDAIEASIVQGLDGLIDALPLSAAAKKLGKVLYRGPTTRAPTTRSPIIVRITRPPLRTSPRKKIKMDAVVVRDEEDNNQEDEATVTEHHDRESVMTDDREVAVSQPVRGGEEIQPPVVAVAGEELHQPTGVTLSAGEGGEEPPVMVVSEEEEEEENGPIVPSQPSEKPEEEEQQQQQLHDQSVEIVVQKNLSKVERHDVSVEIVGEIQPQERETLGEMVEVLLDLRPLEQQQQPVPLEQQQQVEPDSPGLDYIHKKKQKMVRFRSLDQPAVSSAAAAAAVADMSLAGYSQRSELNSTPVPTVYINSPRTRLSSAFHMAVKRAFESLRWREGPQPGPSHRRLTEEEEEGPERKRIRYTVFL